jgi:hypothetical protein
MCIPVDQIFWNKQTNKQNYFYLFSNSDSENETIWHHVLSTIYDCDVA